MSFFEDLSHRRGLPPTLRRKAPDADRFLRPKDQDAFAYTAWWFNVHILVRRSNPKSVERIGQPGTEPKGPDTKAKTCQNNGRNPDTGRSTQVAGLVGDPTRVGRTAYSAGKYDKAVKEWEAFRRTGRLDETVTIDEHGRPSKLYLRDGAQFFVDTNPNSTCFGALMRSSSGLTTAAKYIHGDYDLFAIIPADNPATNIVVAEQHLISPLHRLNMGRPGHGIPDGAKDAAVPNFRGQKFADVQMMLNRRIGVPMVLHGSQEKAVNSFDEEVDVFLANGQDSFSILSEGNLRHFYSEVLGGRKLHNFMGGPSAGDRQKLPGSLWQSVGGSQGPAVTQVDLMECRANWTLVR